MITGLFLSLGLSSLIASTFLGRHALIAAVGCFTLSAIRAWMFGQIDPPKPTAVRKTRRAG